MRRRPACSKRSSPAGDGAAATRLGRHPGAGMGRGRAPLRTLDLDEPRIPHALRQQVPGHDAGPDGGDDPVPGQERDAHPRPLDHEPSRGDEQEAAHRSRSGHRAASQRTRRSRRTSARSGSRSGTSRRSTTRPASPPVARTANRRPRTPRSTGERNAEDGLAGFARRKVDQRQPAGRQLQLDRGVAAGQPQVAGLASAAHAPRDGERADGDQGVGEQVAQDPPALVLVLDRAERGEQAGRVEGDLHDARPAETVGEHEERGRGRDRRPGAAGEDHDVRRRTRRARMPSPPPAAGEQPAGLPLAAAHPRRRGRPTG